MPISSHTSKSTKEEVETATFFNILDILFAGLETMEGWNSFAVVGYKSDRFLLKK